MKERTFAVCQLKGEFTDGNW